MDDDRGRMRFIDGLRGLSIVTVALWHLYGPTYARLLPFGRDYAAVPVIGQGWVGVQMFFLISGMVIFMTLERCRGFGDFMARRFLRLFPAMAIASAILFAFHRATNLPAPEGPPDWLDLLPGLTFVSPSFYHAILHLSVRTLDDVYWTLHVEVAFYALFGFLFFRFGWRVAVIGLIASAVAIIAARPVVALIGAPSIVLRVVEPFEWLQFQQFGWFASGAIFAKARETGSDRLFVAAAGIALASAIVFQAPAGIDPPSRVALIVVALVFTAAQRWRALQRVLSSWPLLMLGFISYPLYLLHNYLGLMMTAVVVRVLPGLPSVLAPLPGLLGIGMLSWLIATRAEPAMRDVLRPWLLPRRQPAP